MKRLFFFYNKILRPELLLRSSYNNIFDLPKLKSLKITVIASNIKKETDISLLNSFLFIEFLGNQKPCVRKIFVGLKNKKRFFVVVISCDLRGQNLYNFLDYFMHCVLPFYKVRQLTLKKKLDRKGSFTFFLKDMYVFFKLPEKFLSFKYGFSFSLFFYNKDKFSVLRFLKLLSIF